MAYHQDKKNNAIVINGFEQGIADDPYAGIADIRNINLISIPKEASVNFSTAQVSPPPTLSGNITSADATDDTVLLTGATTLTDYQAIIFTGASLPTGVVAGTVYWVIRTTGQNFTLSAGYQMLAVVDISATGTGTWATVNMGIPKYFTYLARSISPAYFMVDSNGRCWTNLTPVLPNGNLGIWRFAGNTSNTAGGNGIVSYISSTGKQTGIGYIFIFNPYSIDYAKINGNNNPTITWTYGWNPADGSSGNTNYLKSYSVSRNTGDSHEALVAPDNVVYFCDSIYIGRWFENTGQVFDPANTATYTFDETRLLPFTDTAQCLTFLGTNLMIGGQLNVIYPWDTTSPTFSYPIFVAEYNIQKMVTVNTNTFALVGNRGRVYYTNGSQAQLYKKLPDHLSGTVEPYYQWGGMTTQKNQIYFSALVTTNAGASISQYGGVWAIDVDTKALRLTNKLSYKTYNGYASALIPNFGTNPSGTGLFIGWNNGVSVNAPNNGIDTTISDPYTNSEAYVVSDLIPIGTFDNPTDFERVEYKLSKPMVAGESVAVYVRLIFDTSDTGFGTALINDTTAGNFSKSAPVNFKNAQWVQLKAVLNSTATNPSYTRLTELRIKGAST